MRTWIAVLVLSFRFLAFAQQQNCPVPPGIGVISHDVNMFSDAQEVDLGDAMAEQTSEHTEIIQDEVLTANLQAVGDRIVQYLPANNLKFRFYLIELPEANAFSIAGGRVYVARKMIALTQNEDELAGLLAHELGHIVSHQSAIYITQRFREVLGVTEVRDRADIFDKFHLYTENEARKSSHAPNPNEDKAQFAADQIALYAMARAGYAPHAYVDLWDRFQQTHGKTGSWFSNLFGSTNPSERRLREMRKNVQALPPGCANIAPRSSTEFSRWQTLVVAYSRDHKEESLPGLISKNMLPLPLRPELSHVRFSPDGKYILAQDEGGVHVLTRQPLAPLFSIVAGDAEPAVFSADSKTISFNTSSLRVETWSIDEQTRRSVRELALPKSCLQSLLSPDASVLACVSDDSELLLIDVASATTIASRKSFYILTLLDFLNRARNPGFGLPVTMHFSPDGRYFLAGSGARNIGIEFSTQRSTTFAFDLQTRHELSLPGSIRDILSSSFAFIGPDRLLGVNPSNPAKSPLLQFPSGERRDQFGLSNTIHLDSVSHGDYVLIHPLTEFPLGLFELKSKQVFGLQRLSFDVYDGTAVHENLNGQIGLEDLTSRKPLASVPLPQSQLAPLRAATASPDLNWLAISTRSRGAVWNLKENIRTHHIRPFRGAWFGSDHSFYVDVDKFEKNPRTIIRLGDKADDLEEREKFKDEIVTQVGRYLVQIEPKYDRSLGLYNADVQVRDVRDNHVVWTRHFAQEVPAFSLSGDILSFTWPLRLVGGRNEISHFPDLQPRSEREDYICELVNLASNSAAGTLLIKTNKGSFQVKDVFVEGEWAVVAATGDQILTYSLTSGQQKSHFFGSHPVTSSTGLLAFESESSRIKLYDLATSQLQNEYQFPEPVAFKQFAADGKRMLVLTSGQNVYFLDATFHHSP